MVDGCALLFQAIVKHIPTKQQLRMELHQQTDQFLTQGGSVTRVNPGESGFPGRIPRGSQTLSFDKPKTSYTYLPKLVATLDARKAKKTAPAVKKTPTKPRKKIIYDDFGEPVREVWVES